MGLIRVHTVPHVSCPFAPPSSHSLQGRLTAVTHSQSVLYVYTASVILSLIGVFLAHISAAPRARRTSPRPASPASPATRDWRFPSHTNDDAEEFNDFEINYPRRLPVEEHRRQRDLDSSRNKKNTSESDENSHSSGNKDATAKRSSTPSNNSAPRSRRGTFSNGGGDAINRSASGSSSSTMDGFVITPTSSEADGSWDDVGEDTPLLQA